jgi:hypothetical protein
MTSIPLNHENEVSMKHEITQTDCVASGTCQDCKEKKIRKAYRTLCDPCAHVKKVCPSCCQRFDELRRIKEDKEKEKLLNESASASAVAVDHDEASRMIDDSQAHEEPTADEDEDEEDAMNDEEEEDDEDDDLEDA